MADFAPTRNTYSSTQPIWARDLLKSENHGRLIDGDAMLAAFPTGVVPSGTPIAKVNTTSLGAPAATADSTPDGFLINELKVQAGGRYLEGVFHAGTITERLLPGGSAPAAFKTALTAVSFI
ncbi:hypothetical protein [Modestobacter sp. VKM Ac-2985]|uniref:hypothetical protein n=1 Tax=Modestobacter sp. VKM Ac-2985 TaxID=3004139 RepID=UPI0022ABB134|nr:hypothetical protein [Modestobacter sp. VKM Ac-2985]MCZ2837145.1 hypothetical protein [Modestobacter sp. VKM Ac-2985]